MVTAVAPRTRRVSTPERWQAALRRALDSGITIRQVSNSGAWVVSSASRPTVCYLTDGIECGCEAAMLGGDSVCQHRALYWYTVGALDLDPEPEPPAPAAPAPAPVPMTDCWHCGGKGTERITGATGRVFVVDCAACHGAGEVPDGSDRTDVPDAPDAATPRPGTVVCPGCGRVGVLIQDKPLPAGWMCNRCRPPALTPVLLAPGYDVAGLLAA